MSDTIRYGIDLGTTNSAIAVLEGDTVSMVKNNDGWDFTPSAVWLPKPDVVHVGRRARERAVRDPDDVAAEFKLEMGIAGAERRFGRAGVTRTPQQLSAEVLRSLRNDAAHQFGSAPAAAVITVPAAFALNQNMATREAASLAGFGAQCPLVQEPTAAAFAYGFHNAAESTRWLVFDLGGGTFDAAIVSKDDGELQVLNHAGDPYLGGKLIDWAIVEQLLVPAVRRDLGLVDFSRGNPTWRLAFTRLKAAAEEAKMALSRQTSVDIVVDLPDGSGGEEPFEHTLTRGALDQVAEPFYARAVRLSRAAIEEGGLRPDDLDRVLLVGGATLSPGLRALLGDPRTGLGVPLDFSEDPTTVVARGAAIFAATLRLNVPLPAPEPGRFVLELAYEPVTSITDPTVGGRLHAAGPVDWSGYRVSLHDPDRHPAFHGEQVAPSAEGVFVTTVAVEERHTCQFTVELVDGGGVPQQIVPDRLSITHRDEVFVGAVLTHSLGIVLADREFAPLLRKGVALPARAREVFRTSRTLHRADNGSTIRIPIVEGERSRGDRNRRVGMVEIRPVDVRMDVPAGSDVEITLDIDESRIVTVVADVPVVGELFDAEVNLDDVRALDPRVLTDLLAAAERRVAEQRAAAHAAGSEHALELLAALDRDEVVATVRAEVRAAQVDLGAAAACEDRIRALDARLDDVAEAAAHPGVAQELRQVLDECADLAEGVGDAVARRELADLRRAAGQSGSLAAVLDRAYDLRNALARRRPDWPVRLFAGLRALDLQPPGTAAALVREGEQAIAAGDVQALSAVNQRLIRLLPDHDRDAVIGLTRR